jgi:hypothetical protein
MVNIDDIVLAVVDYLNERQVPYMIVGSLATNDQPRMTRTARIEDTSVLSVSSVVTVVETELKMPEFRRVETWRPVTFSANFGL